MLDKQVIFDGISGKIGQTLELWYTAPHVTCMEDLSCTLSYVGTTKGNQCSSWGGLISALGVVWQSVTWDVLHLFYISKWFQFIPKNSGINHCV